MESENMMIGKYRVLLSMMVMIWLLPALTFAQTGTPVSELNKRQTKWYEAARSAGKQGAFPEALEALDRLLSEAPELTEGYYLRGSIHYEQRAYEPAIRDLGRVLELDPNYDPVVRYQLGLAHKGAGQYEAAVDRLEQFLAAAGEREGQVERARKHLADAQFAAEAVRRPVAFSPQNIGSPISTDQPEYLPVPSADGRSLVFTRRVGRQEDFFVAEKGAAGWENVQPLSDLNSPYSEGAQTISADGRLMVFTFCQSGPDQGGCNLYYAEKCNGSWSRPQPIEGSVNTGAWEAQPSLSADGNLLLFASNRPGGLGGNDIWACRRNRSGQWGKPVNLGAAVNSAGNDQSPFLHADGRTLYFSSDGRPGMGDNDLYLIRLQEDGQWGEVQNLGYPINTPDHEGALAVSLDGTTGYFAKSPGGPEDLDIFTFTLDPAIRPLPVAYVRGKIFDSKTGQTISARAELIDLEAGRPVAIVTNCEDGSYLVCLTAGKNYALNVNKEGYLFFSEHFSLAGATVSKAIELDVPLQPIEPAGRETADKPRPVVLNNVFFATGSAELLPASTDELDRLLQLLQDHPALRIQINGHTDNVGTEEANRVLSEARARAVYAYLTDKGIAADRLRYRGFGETVPLADNDSEEGRRRNRRTEFERWDPPDAER